MVMKENDEDVILFHEMDNCKNGKDDLCLFENSDKFINASLDSNTGSAPIFKTGPVADQTAVDEFLCSENDKSDSDWLLTPPGTPPVCSEEKQAPKALMPHNGNSGTRPTDLKSKSQHANPASVPAPEGDESSPDSILSSTICLDAGSRGTSSSGGISTASSSSRSATPVVRTTLAMGTKPVRSSTPTSRPTLLVNKTSAVPLGSSTTRRSSTPTARPSSILSTNSAPRSASTTRRSSTPTARPSLTLSATKSGPRSATPTARTSIPNLKSASRSSTPTVRPSIIATTKSAPRSSTPTARPTLFAATKSAPRSSTPTNRTSSTAPTSSAPPGKLFPSVTKSGPSSANNPAPTRSNSPAIRSRSSAGRPSEVPGYSHNTPSNTRKTVSDRPVSASKSRAGRPVTAHSLVTDSNVSQRRQSLSASRARAPVTTSVQYSKSFFPSMNRSRSSNDDDDYVNPIEIGTQMVERVVNSRKLVPPKQDTDLYSNTYRKSSDSSGFGRSLSKKSLDMAMRHMDIQRSMSGTLRPLMTNTSASSLYSMRSIKGSRSVTAASDSPVATSSDTSSELIMNSQYLEGSDIDDNDRGSERGYSSLSGR